MAVTPVATDLRLGQLPTPLREATRLGPALGLAGRLLVKRDDLTGFAVAGTKLRPLRALVADALAAGADTFVTGGAPGSNFCQAAVVAARCAGLSPVLVRPGSPGPGTAHPNHAAAVLWGATEEWTGDPDRRSVDDALHRVAEAVRRRGGRPYVVPRGGATPVGATGTHAGAAELAEQLATLGVTGPVAVVLAAGSGGTAAGLVSGSVALGRRFGVLAASVSRPPAETRARVLELARGCAGLLGTPSPSDADLVLTDARGRGHGLASREDHAAADLALVTEGLVLDPVYSAKALAALPGLLGSRANDPRLCTVFWHTGGLLDAVAGWTRHD